MKADARPVGIDPKDPIEVTKAGVAAAVSGIGLRKEITVAELRERYAEIADEPNLAGGPPRYVPEQVLAERRADTEEWDYKRLLYTGKDVLNIGKGRLVITYAERDPRRIQITCRSGKAAKRTQMMLRRDLRNVSSDAEYNKVLDAFFAAIEKAQESR